MHAKCRNNCSDSIGLNKEMKEGKKCAKANLAAKGFQGPNLKEGLVDTSGCVSLR